MILIKMRIVQPCGVLKMENGMIGLAMTQPSLKHQCVKLFFLVTDVPCYLNVK